MRLEIHFRNTDASEDEKKALRARVERKIRKVTRFLKDPVTVEMNIKGEKVGFYGDLHITSAGTSTLKARIEGDDPVAVIDGLLHTVGRAARRNHDRVVTRHHKPAPATDGDYPNLNIPAERATEQRSPADSRARLSELKAVQRQREKEEASNKVVSEEKRLRKLSRTRPKEVLREIEGE